MTTYTVFKRKVYRRENGQYIPHPSARRQVIQRGVSYARAIELCKDGPANKALKEGREYRGLTFYEFTSDY